MPRRNPKGTSDRALQSLHRLAGQLKARRKTLGISSSATAEAAGMSRVTLHRIEKGVPSVTMGSYLSVMSALGLELTMRESSKKRDRANLPKKITLGDYPLLKRLAWQLKGLEAVSPAVALGIYERNWKHVNVNEVTPEERELIENLLAAFGKGRLLV